MEAEEEGGVENEAAGEADAWFTDTSLFAVKRGREYFERYRITLLSTAATITTPRPIAICYIIFKADVKD